MTCSICVPNAIKWDIYLITEVMEMADIIDKIFFVALCVLCAVALFTLTKWLIAYATEKEKTLVGSRESLLAGIIAPALFLLVFIIELLTGKTEWIYLIAGVCEIVYLPAATFSILTPKGICRNFSLKRSYVPVSELSYEFTDQYLAMYFNNRKKNNMVKYHIGIKNMDTVKMLADWYPKHNMTNPLLPGYGDNENTEK